MLNSTKISRRGTQGKDSIGWRVGFFTRKNVFSVSIVQAEQNSMTFRQSKKFFEFSSAFNLLDP